MLGQRCVDGKSNEITAVPELLDQLALQNSIVTLDAMGCQTAIAENILARGGDYLLALKGNTLWHTQLLSSTSTSAASAMAHPAGPIATRSTTRMAAWCAVGCSPARMPP